MGNKAFGESTLKGLFDLDTGGMLSWYTKSDRYSRQDVGLGTDGWGKHSLINLGGGGAFRASPPARRSSRPSGNFVILFVRVMLYFHDVGA